MHPNQIFRRHDEGDSIQLLRQRSFGTLAINAEGGPLLAHVPFVLSEDASEVELHLVRSNPILREIKEPQRVVLSVTGPHSYISPDWYGVEDQVPTWNYVAVHLRGELSILDQGELSGVLDRLSAQFEQRINGKAPWKSDKMTPDVLTKMMRMIVPCRLRIDDLQSTWKLNQNKTEAARHRAAHGVAAAGIGQEVDQLRDWMLAVAGET